MDIYEEGSTDGSDFKSKKEAALYYANRGWPVFPLKPNGKTPITEHGFKDATQNVDQIKKWWMDTPDANIGVPTGSVSGFWVIDVDRKNDKDGLKLLLDTLQDEDKVAFKTALDSNLVQATTNDGLHILVQWSPESPVRNGTDVMEGIDLRGEGGYIVVEPSTVEKVMYQWSDLSLPLVLYHTWMDSLFAKKDKSKNGKPRQSKGSAPRQSTAAFITKLFIKPPPQGSRDKLLLKAATKLARAGVREDIAGAVCMAIGHRCSPPAVDIAAAKVKYVYANRRSDKTDTEAAFPVFTALRASNEEQIPKTMDQWFAFFNQHFAAVWIGKDFFILSEEQNDTRFLTKRAFTDMLANVIVMVPSRFNSDEMEEAEVSELWLKSPGRRTYKAVVFDPSSKCPETEYNLWKGFAVTPKQGECSLYWELIREVICDRDEDLYQYVRKWMAQAVQHPEVNPEIALVLRGKQGTGKNTAIELFGQLFGKAFGVYDSTERVLGRFTGHLKDKLLILADEAMWGGNKKDEGVLKAFITAKVRIIEHKGVDLYEVKNLTRLVVASNESWAVPVGIDDRRFVFCDVSDKRKEDTEFFAKLHRQMMQEGGLEALMHDLMNEDLSGWLPQQHPKNNDLRSTDLKIMSMTPVQRFVFGWLDTGGLIRYMESDRKSGFGVAYRYKVVFSLFYTEYQDWVNEHKLTRVETNNMFSRIVFGTEDTKRGLSKEGLLPYEYSKNTTVDGRKGKVYELPDIHECRRWFEDHVAHGRLEWTSEAEEWDPRRSAIEKLTDNVFQPLKWGTKS